MPSVRSAALLLIALTAAALPARGAEAERVGVKVGDFTLKSHFGKDYSLHDFADREIVVVLFLGTECPLAKLYGPRIAELSKSLAAKGVAFVGIDANRQDSLQEVGAYAQRNKFEFPILLDTGNAIADRFGACARPRFSFSIAIESFAMWAASTTSMVSMTASAFNARRPDGKTWSRRSMSC